MFGVLYMLLIKKASSRIWQRAFAFDNDTEALVAVPFDLSSSCFFAEASTTHVCSRKYESEAPWLVRIPGACPHGSHTNRIFAAAMISAKSIKQKLEPPVSEFRVACYRISRLEAQVIVAWPPVGYIGSETTMEVRFAVVGDGRGRDIRIDFAGANNNQQQQEAIVESHFVSIVLNSIEPATHVIGFQVEGGPRQEIAFDIVLTNLEAHRELYPASAAPPRPDVLSGPTQKIRLVFIGSMRLDGQKTIWLEQLRRLDRARFESIYLSFEEPSTELPALLADLGIEFHSAPIPPIGFEEIEHKPADGGEPLKYNGTQASLDAYLLHRLELAATLEDCTPAWAQRTWHHLIHTIAQARADVVIFANARDSSDLLLSQAAQIARRDTKLVAELPNLFPLPDAAVDIYVAPSRYAANHASVRDLPTVVIPPGVDADIFKPLRESESVFTVVGFVARVAPEKSPNLFVHTAAILVKTHPLARFVMIGDGEALDATKELARFYGLAELDFVGKIPHGKRLAQKVATFDIVVNPSLRAWSETFCIANIEAMSCGAPLVSFGVGGVGEYFLPESTSTAPPNGILVHESTPQALAAAVASLLDNPKRRRELGVNARRTVLDRFQVQHQMSAYAHLYTSLLTAP